MEKKILKTNFTLKKIFSAIQIRGAPRRGLAAKIEQEQKVSI